MRLSYSCLVPRRVQIPIFDILTKTFEIKNPKQGKDLRFKIKDFFYVIPSFEETSFQPGSGMA